MKTLVKRRNSGKYRKRASEPSRFRPGSLETELAGIASKISKSELERFASRFSFKYRPLRVWRSETMKVFVDTAYFIAILNPLDQLAESAAAAHQQLANAKLARSRVKIMWSFLAHGGADPLVRSRPPGRLFVRAVQADEGVGRGPGGPPHNASENGHVILVQILTTEDVLTEFLNAICETGPSVRVRAQEMVLQVLFSR